MSVVISGALTDGAGIPMSGYHIILKSRVNTPEVVMHTVADVMTGNDGEYCFHARTGKYGVYLKQDWRNEYCVGDIAVYDDSKPGTLNDFLIAPDEGDLKPDVVKRFEEMVAQAQQSAGAAAGNAQQTAQDVAAAAGYARAAEQAKNDIDAALTGTLKTANHLSEIAAAGEKAQQKSRDNLGLKSAATMEAQSDIYDRTKGRLAIPGAFGFGRAFLHEDTVRFDTEDDFLVWVRNALPGEYSVAGPYGIIIPDTRFEGGLSIRWTDARPETREQRRRAKSLTFYGINGPIYHARYRLLSGFLTDWVKINITTEDIIYRIVASSVRNRWGAPDIGGLIIAAYQGEADGDKDIRLVRGRSYRGSRLGPVGISAPCTPTGTHIVYPQYFITGCSEHSLPGSYCALSGVPDTYVSGAMLGLFIRTS
ncbi:prophage tail fiber N-terminal domain-containing protein [Shigella boydii]|uniref:prophage tail fiber N-terminal domain-containing protein n=1 Tax=Shigella boydii TaxID=621 RepID=UPI00020A58DA|nr:prophage tail fiber N-terminal domain-containing protein [Shigella boydii]EGI96267.1 prophage tail fiber family protein [Shigella boydii 5216-82]